jgi:hypothetical protein
MLLLSEHHTSEACKPSTKHCSSVGRKRCTVKYFRFSLQRLLVCTDDRFVTYVSYDYYQTACFLDHMARRLTFYIYRCICFDIQPRELISNNCDGLDIVVVNINTKVSMSLEFRRFVRYILLDLDSTSFLLRLYLQKTSNKYYLCKDTCIKTAVACSCPSSQVPLQSQTKLFHFLPY